MKKLLFLTVLSLFLGFSVSTTAHDTRAITYSHHATQQIFFNITYGFTGTFVLSGTIWVNGIVRSFVAGGIAVQANIGDSFSAWDASQSYSAGGTITDTYMDVKLW